LRLPHHPYNGCCKAVSEPERYSFPFKSGFEKLCGRCFDVLKLVVRKDEMSETLLSIPFMIGNIVSRFWTKKSCQLGDYFSWRSSLESTGSAFKILSNKTGMVKGSVVIHFLNNTT
jgi:hypothetical protein